MRELLTAYVPMIKTLTKVTDEWLMLDATGIWPCYSLGSLSCSKVNFKEKILALSVSARLAVHKIESLIRPGKVIRLHQMPETYTKWRNRWSKVVKATKCKQKSRNCCFQLFLHHLTICLCPIHYILTLTLIWHWHLISHCYAICICRKDLLK